jgi:tetratricopeptide (TPR) repeat protein
MFRQLMLALALFSLLPVAQAARDDELVAPLQERWAEIKYTLPEKQQAEHYAALAQQAHALSEANPNVAAVLIWEGIIVSSEAGARGGVGALSLAKQARKLLEESLKLDEGAMNGSAYTSLGTLYAKVPRWPIGFGDQERAEALFQKALEINPQGIDANFFYGEYLVERKREAEGRDYLERALLAPPRPGRELADAGRREEAHALLNKIVRKAD